MRKLEKGNTHIIFINNPARRIFPEMKNVREIFDKSIDIIDECLSDEMKRKSEPLDIMNMPLYVGDRRNVWGYCYQNYSYETELYYPTHIFINRFLLENGVDDNISIEILIHELLHCTIYSEDDCEYDNKGKIIGSHHGIWRERVNEIMKRYHNINPLRNYDIDLLKSFGVNAASYNESLISCNGNLTLNEYIDIPERFDDIDNHIKDIINVK